LKSLIANPQSPIPNLLNVESLDPKQYIIIKGARVHNLKNIDLALPRNKFIVITGLSGSGKSSLAFDTLYAEGQRRYVESLSAYARQFLGKIDKPDVDYIKGISPAIAIEQKVITRNPRSTVGTSTEIYDYLKLLFARIGKTYSPVSGILVKRHTVTDVVDFILSKENETTVILLSPLEIKKGRSVFEQLQVLLQQGFVRIKADAQIFRIEDFIEQKIKLPAKTKLYLLIDRITVNHEDEDLPGRIADSVQTGFYEGNEEIIVEFSPQQPSQPSQSSQPVTFSNRFEADGIIFEAPTTHLFSFNNPYGACKKCEGFGSVIGIDEDLVIPDKSKSIYEEAIVCWKGASMSEWKNLLVMTADKFNFPIHRPYYDLTNDEKHLLWTGNRYFKGLNEFFKYLEAESYKIQYRVMLSRYRGKTICPECRGTRLRKDATYVKVAGKSISDMVVMPIADLALFFDSETSGFQLSEYDFAVAKRLLLEIKTRLQFLLDVGLGYLTLNRLSSTLSGGESQRINLASSLGSSLVGSMYILDEPSIGLHPRDTQRLIKVLKSLKSLGNTVIVVEHDEEIMRASDMLVDIGPFAGTGGGNVIFQGNHDDILTEKQSLTARYLTGKEIIEVPKRRQWRDYIMISGARENNLKAINVKFPLHVMTVVTGVSGSGKSTLVKRILFPALKKIYGGHGEATGQYDKIEGDINRHNAIEFVDQNPIGKSSRSNPVTYIKAYDEIRTLFAEQPLSKSRGYKPAYFSFNVDGGRCEVCEGEGEVKIEMQFMADIHLVCDNCNGKRFKSDILEVQLRGKNIADVLDLTVDEAVEFFGKDDKKVSEKLKPLADVGLGYVKLGQSSSTLSGGEAQRIKLASFLNKSLTGLNTIFVFDEPTTGLHFHDIKKLLNSFNALLKTGNNSIIVIEHNPEVIKCADWVIDLGPEGGEKGGNIVFEGTPEDLIKHENSYTAKYLIDKL